jgi:hypothetical protein
MNKKINKVTRVEEDTVAMSDFDLFAPPPTNDLQEEIVRGRYQWTNKSTKVLGGLFVVVGLLSAGAWYGHHVATTATTAGSSARGSFASALGGSGFGGSGFGRGNRSFSGTGSATGSSGFAFGGGAGPASGFSFGSSGKVSSVSNGKITITLNNPDTTLSPGDRVTLIPRSTGAPAFGAAAGGANTGTTSQTPQASGTQSSTSILSHSQNSATSTGATGNSSTATPTGSKTSSKPSLSSTSGSKPTVSGSKPTVTGQRGGSRFSNPAFTKCLADNGVTLTPGTRPDRSDPKVAAALQACFSKLGGGFGGARPAGAPGFSGAPGAPTGSGASGGSASNGGGASGN